MNRNHASDNLPDETPEQAAKHSKARAALHDDLHNMLPTASIEFEQALEAQVISHLTRSQEAHMQTETERLSPVYRPMITPRSSGRNLLTLFAAFGIVIVIGAILLVSQKHDPSQRPSAGAALQTEIITSQPTIGISATHTATPLAVATQQPTVAAPNSIMTGTLNAIAIATGTPIIFPSPVGTEQPTVSPLLTATATSTLTITPPIPFAANMLPGATVVPFMTYYDPVLIALQDIPQGTIITHEMFTQVQWPAGLPGNPVPNGAIASMPDVAPEALIAQNDIAQWSPILGRDVPPDTGFIANNPDARAAIPPQWQALSVPVERGGIQIEGGLRPGNTIDILVRNMTAQGIVNSQKVIAGARLTAYHPEADPTQIQMTVAMPAQDMILFDWLLKTDLILALTRAEADDILGDGQPPTAEPPQSLAAILPPGTVAISVPVKLILIEGWVEVGQRVNISATLRVIDVDELDEFQQLIESQDATSPNNDDVVPTPALVTQQIATDALVLDRIIDFELGRVIDDDGLIILAVTRQDAVMLTWLIEANIPLTMRFSEGE